MKKTVPFEIFGANQYLELNIMRLARLEEVLGRPIAEVVSTMNIGINFAIKALPIAMSQHYHNATPAFFADKIEEYLEQGGSFDDIAVPLAKAVVVSGFFGKAQADRAMGVEVLEEPKNESPAVKKPSKQSKNG